MYENRLVFWSRVFLIEARYLPWTIKRIYHEAYRRLFYPHRVEVNYGGGRAALIVNGHVVAVEGDECHDMELAKMVRCMDFRASELAVKLGLPNDVCVQIIGAEQAIQNHKLIWGGAELLRVKDDAIPPNSRYSVTRGPDERQPHREAHGRIESLRNKLAYVRHRHPWSFHR